MAAITIHGELGKYIQAHTPLLLTKAGCFFRNSLSMFARHVCRAEGLKETLSPNQREDNP
ncbi:hypothetical protein L7E55_13695 [Pelotomaculum isophthalicicum JI]|uniref:Uncharacterized protein n=1 Tax=Pelotomaculum isophthalicicum JI TaxID=947010 RepID=A0A9X4H340_9FIRM|nr:hypothetical protein [Pelotomaculum isophthalicicum]MDF9409396.1 hypothetical protein [Pelotomaculum isophthalicicum JI]